MTEEFIMEKFREAKRNRIHLVDLTGCGSWVCPTYFMANKSNFIPLESTSALNKLNFCPFCGEHISENREDEKIPTKRYIVYHYQPYYFGEVVTDEWYWVDFDCYDDAMNEYQSLICVGFPEEDVLLEDTRYGATFRLGEWDE